MANIRSSIRLPRGWSLGLWKWWRWPALAGILLLIAWLGYYYAPSRRPTNLLILLVGAIGGLALIWLFSRWPALGLVLIIPVGMTVEYGLGTGTQTEINGTIMLIVMLLGIWLFGMIDRYRTIKLYQSRTTLPLIIFLVVAVLAFLNGQLVWFNVPGASLPAQIGGLMVMVLSVAAFFLAANLIDDIRWLKWMTLLLILFGAVYSITILDQRLGRFSATIFTWGGTSSQFWTWFMAMVFSQAWLNRDLKKSWRIGLWLIFVVAIYATFVVSYGWKSGWLPAFVAIIAIVGLRSWQTGLIMGVVGLVVAPTLFGRLLSSDAISFSARVEAWQILGEIIKVNPVLGLGPANYYWYTPLYRISGYTGLNFNSHNQYVDLVAQIGILGLICFLWIFWEVAQVGLAMRKRVLSGFERAFLYGALGGLVATLFSGMLGDWTLPFIYNVGIVGFRSSIMGWLFFRGSRCSREIDKGVSDQRNESCSVLGNREDRVGRQHGLQEG